VLQANAVDEDVWLAVRLIRFQHFRYGWKMLVSIEKIVGTNRAYSIQRHCFVVGRPHLLIVCDVQREKHIGDG
jgi:hypothetical protein